MKKISLSLFSIALTCSAFAQSYTHAISLLKENKRNEARKELHEVVSSDKDKADALLALCIMDADDENYLQGFHDFKEFFAVSPNPYPYVYSVEKDGIFGSGECVYNDEVIEFLEKLSQDPKAGATIQQSALDQVALKYRRHRDFKKAAECYKQIADIGNWSSVGVFENVSGSGFNKDFGVLQHPGADYTFTNKTGAPVKWFPLIDARNDRWWDMEYNYDVDDAIIYNQTFIQSDDDKEVLLLVGVSGSMKLWLNDMLIGSKTEERNTDGDVYTYKVKLQKGNNRLLLQLGSSEIARNNFRIRLADLNGNLIRNVNTRNVYSAYNKAQPYEVKEIPFAPETFFESEVNAHPDDLIRKILLLQVYNRNEKKYESQKLAIELKKEVPKSSIVSELYINTMYLVHDEIDENKEVEFVKNNDPESLYGFMLRTNDAKTKENWDEALTLTKKRIELYGENSETSNLLIGLYAKKENRTAAIEEIEKARKKYPYINDFLTYQYILASAETKDLKQANKLLRDYSKEIYDVDIINEIVANDLKTGDKQDAKDLYEEMISRQPTGVGIFTSYAIALYGMNEHEKALDMLRKAAAIAPYVGKLYYMQGEIYEEDGKKPEAIDMLHKAITYTPTNYDARKMLRSVEGKKDLFVNFRENNAKEIFQKAQQDSNIPKDQTVYLLKDVKDVVYPENGAKEEQEEDLVMINSQSDIDNFKDIKIPYNSYTQRLVMDKAELFKKDGSTVPADVEDNVVVFSSLEVGDCLHLSYKLEDSYEGRLAEHFWNEFEFNGTYPINLSRYSLIVPANKKFNYKVFNTQITPETKDIDDYKLYIWEKKDMPKVVVETLMPEEALESITVSSIPDWSYVANWYRDVSSIKAVPDYAVKEEVKQLLSQKNMNDFDKARTIYNYIEKNMHYSNVPFLHSAYTPQRASRTLTSKLGDCKDLSTLFVSMAREAGLDVSLILVSTRDNMNEHTFALPSISFNHCIARMRSNNKDYIIELTNNDLSFTTLPASLINAYGLYIPKESETATDASLAKLNTDNRPSNTITRTAQMSFDNNNLSIRRSVLRTGSEAAEMRAFYQDKTKDEREKDLTSSLSSEFSKNLKLQSMDIDDITTLVDSFTVSYTFKIDNYANEIVGMKVFKMPWADKSPYMQELVSLDTRKYPLELWRIAPVPTLREIITVNIPKGKKLAEMPKDVVIGCDALSYTVNYVLKNDKLIATREIKYKKEEVSPQEYEAFKKVVNKMNEADVKDIVIK